MGQKIYSKCKRLLPLDSDHFNHKCDTKDGYTSRCKECLGRKFTININYNYIEYLESTLFALDMSA